MNKIEFNITPIPKFGMLPKVEMVDKNLLVELGEKGIRQMVNDHYNLLRISKIAHLFPSQDEEFEKAKKHSSDFFVQLMGGYPYFNESRGNPMLRKRHMPFAINESAREIWLDCYRTIIAKLNVTDDLKLSFWNYLDSFSMMMVNSE